MIRDLPRKLAHVALLGAAVFSLAGRAEARPRYPTIAQDISTNGLGAEPVAILFNVNHVLGTVHGIISTEVELTIDKLTAAGCYWGIEPFCGQVMHWFHKTEFVDGTNRSFRLWAVSKRLEETTGVAVVGGDFTGASVWAPVLFTLAMADVSNAFIAKMSDGARVPLDPRSAMLWPETWEADISVHIDRACVQVYDPTRSWAPVATWPVDRPGLWTDVRELADRIDPDMPIFIGVAVYEPAFDERDHHVWSTRHAMWRDFVDAVAMAHERALPVRVGFGPPIGAVDCPY